MGLGDREVMFLTVTDLDQDQRRDVVCAVRGRGISLLLGNATGGWQLREIPLPRDCGTGKGIAVGHINGDGKNDIAFTCDNARDRKSGVRWLSFASDGKRTGGVWEDREISGPQGVKFDRVELLDLDADGDLDVITCEEHDNLGVVWYENPMRSR